MKGLNVKKLVAIGVGAALIGSALAPIASAVSLEKSQVVGSNGVPVVDIVVGANAAASDVVWAGNIAAKLAQLSYIDSAVAGANGIATVNSATADVTVGGTVTIKSGAKEEITANLNSASSTKEYVDSIGNSFFTKFKNESKNIKIDNNTTSTTVTETVGVQVDAAFDITHTNVKDLVAVLNAGDLNYEVTLSPTIAQFTDSGSDDYAPISFLGENWVIDSITSNMVTLVKSDAEKVYAVGEEIPIKGVNGADYKYKITGGGVSGSTNNVTLQLIDSNSGAVLQSRQFDQGSDVDFFDATTGNTIIQTKVNVKKISKTTQNNSDVFSFTLLVGNDRVQLKDGARFPYDPNNTTGSFPWIVSLTYSSNALSKITVKNSAKVWDSDHPLYSKEYSFMTPGAVTTGGSASAGILEGSSYDPIGQVKFRGFYDAGVQKSVVKFLSGSNIANVTGDLTTYGAIDYFDTGDVEHSIPLAMKLASSNNAKTGGFTFEGIQYKYSTNTGSSGKTDNTTNANYFLLDQGSTAIGDLAANQVDVNFAFSSDTATTDTFTDVGDINGASPIIQITGKNSKIYRYVYKSHTSGVWLVLAGRGDFNSASAAYLAGDIPKGTNTTLNSGYIDTTYQNTGSIWFLGTIVDDANGAATDIVDFNVFRVAEGGAAAPNSANVAAAMTDANSFLAKYEGVSYYLPDTTDFGAVPGTTSPNKYKTAVFKLKEVDATSYTASSSTMPNAGTANGSFNIYLDTADNGATVDTANNNKTGYAGKTTAVDYIGDKNLSNLSEYSGSSANYVKAYDDNGTKVELSGRQLTFTLPNQRMKTYVTVESSAVTTSSTGDKLTGIAKGATATTPSGTKVTLDNVTVDAVCSAGPGSTAKEIVKVGQLVYTDSDPLPAGNHIIIGGYLVNKFAQDVVLADGTSLQDAVAKNGDKVVEVLENGDVIVAGWTADDTVKAANELVDALDALN